MKLGLDTGGTFTDAVLLDADDRVLASAKAPTTHGALDHGLAAAATQVLSGHDAGAVRLVGVSTTLATNALAEGQGGAVSLVAIGMPERDLLRGALPDALDGGPLVAIGGGHGPTGREAAPLDLAALHAALPTLTGAVAVAGLFATRDPSHERAAAAVLREAGHLVSVSHDLSARLDAPRRALTAVLNARLLPLVGDLLDAVDRMLAERGVRAPVMIVRGDGGLMDRAMARQRPVETILSGPAASLVGAAHLIGARDVLVCDVGGTTSDVGRLDGGRPRLARDGARVGGWATMVEAVALDTFALGGDSGVEPGDAPDLVLGPHRRVPLAVAAAREPALIAAMRAQLAAERPDPLHGLFAVAVSIAASADEDALLACMRDGPVPLVALSRAERRQLDRLVRRGRARLIGFTPTDALHVAGRLVLGSAEAARLGAALVAQRRDRAGRPIAPSPEVLAERTLAATSRRMAERLLEAAWNADGLDGAAWTASAPVQAFLDRTDLTVRPVLAFGREIVGLGAAASAFLPEAARIAGGWAVLPPHAAVANAIGAVVGEVSFTAEIAVTIDGAGYAVSGARFETEADALQHAVALAGERARELATQAGAGTVEVAVTQTIDAPQVDGRRLFLGAQVRARAFGRPRLAYD